MFNSQFIRLLKELVILVEQDQVLENIAEIVAVGESLDEKRVQYFHHRFRPHICTIAGLLHWARLDSTTEKEKDEILRLIEDQVRQLDSKSIIMMGYFAA